MNIECCKSYVGKQIIGLNGGVTPSGQLCLYQNAAPIQDLTYGSFSDPAWDFGGFGPDFSAYAASFGGYAVLDGIYGIGSYDSSNALYFFYLGTSAPPDINYVSPISGPVTFGWTPNCYYGCLSTVTYKFNNSPYDWIGGIANNTIAYANLYVNYGGALDFGLGTAYNEAILATMLSKYQPQATVSVVDDGAGFFRIVFNDFYYSSISLVSFSYNNNLNQEYIGQSPC